MTKTDHAYGYLVLLALAAIGAIDRSAALIQFPASCSVCMGIFVLFLYFGMLIVREKRNDKD